MCFFYVKFYDGLENCRTLVIDLWKSVGISEMLLIKDSEVIQFVWKLIYLESQGKPYFYGSLVAGIRGFQLPKKMGHKRRSRYLDVLSWWFFSISTMLNHLQTTIWEIGSPTTSSKSKYTLWVNLASRLVTVESLNVKVPVVTCDGGERSRFTHECNAYAKQTSIPSEKYLDLSAHCFWIGYIYVVYKRTLKELRTWMFQPFHRSESKVCHFCVCYFWQFHFHFHIVNPSGSLVFFVEPAIDILHEPTKIMALLSIEFWYSLLFKKGVLISWFMKK